MTDTLALTRLLGWLSPVFPTGSFAYSSGLETAVATGRITDDSTLSQWLSDMLVYGSLHNDLVLFAQAWRVHKDLNALEEIKDLALALTASSERHLETTAQGDAFITAVQGVSDWSSVAPVTLPTPCALPVAVGAVCGASHIDLETSLVAYLHSTLSNFIQIAIRLSILGQSGAAQVLATLEASIVAAAQKGQKSSLDDLGSATVTADIMAMQHETQNGRMFRS